MASIRRAILRSAFAGPQSATGVNPVTVVAGDFDAASVNFTSGSLTLQFGNGRESVKSIATFPVAPKLTDGAAGDLDNDGEADLVITSNASQLFVL